jgi:hypothetical protein
MHSALKLWICDLNYRVLFLAFRRTQASRSFFSVSADAFLPILESLIFSKDRSLCFLPREAAPIFSLVSEEMCLLAIRNFSLCCSVSFLPLNLTDTVRQYSLLLFFPVLALLVFARLSGDLLF